MISHMHNTWTKKYFSFCETKPFQNILNASEAAEREAERDAVC